MDITKLYGLRWKLICFGREKSNRKSCVIFSMPEIITLEDGTEKKIYLGRFKCCGLKPEKFLKMPYEKSND